MQTTEIQEPVYIYNKRTTKFRVTYWVGKMDFSLIFSETDKMLSFINTYIMPLKLTFEISGEF